MRSRLTVLVLVSLGMLISSAAPAQEEGGTPPVTVLPVPEPASTSTIPFSESTSSVPISTQEDSQPVSQTESETASDDDSVVHPLLVASFVLVAVGAIVGFGLPRVVFLQRALNRLSQGTSHASQDVSSQGSYEVVALQFTEGGPMPTLRSVGVFVGAREAVSGAHQVHQEWLGSGEGNGEIWLVVRGSCGVIHVLGPDGKVGMSGEAWTQLERMLVDLD